MKAGKSNSTFNYLRGSIFFIGFAILNCVAFTGNAQDSYHISVTNIKDRAVKIAAKIFPKSENILMSPFGATHLKKGWYQFVENLKAWNNKGDKVELKENEGGLFTIPATSIGKELNLSYTVNIKHDLGGWPFGYKEAAYVRNNMLTLTGNSIFITRLDMDSALVSFDVPEDFTIVNAWKEVSSRIFKVSNPEELVWTVLSIGKFDVTKLHAGNINVLIAYDEELRSSKKMIKHVLSKAISTYNKIYGSIPVSPSTSSNKFVCIVGIDSSYEGGGATFTNSLSLMLHAKPDFDKRAESTSWHHILLHEVGHLWNGRSLKTDEQMEWFSEGFTDYLTYKVEKKLRLFSKDEWDKMLIKKSNELLKAKAKMKVSLQDAGNNKGENYTIVYNGGLIFADELDHKIREATHSKKNIDDFMKNMYQAYAVPGKKYSYNDLQKIAQHTCSCDMESLFKKLREK